LRERYRALVSRGEIEPDPAQAEVVDRLCQLLGALAERALAQKSNALGWLFGRARPSQPITGLYVWGGVGRGKTMLMDLFYDSVPRGLPKRRVHFNAFMNDVHERIFRHRTALKQGRVKGEDPIPPVAAAIAAEARLLCFDEFAVTDIADAMILGRLFTALFGHGVTVVATSNVHPDRLYEGGLNRALFLPFIALLKERMAVMELKARTDYRLEKLAAAETYVVATGGEARAALDRAFRRLTGVAEAPQRVLRVKGRDLVVPQAAMGVARFCFADLCEKPLGPADFLAIAEAFHTVMIDAIPVLRPSQRNEAKRFITLVDSLYDRGVKLIASAEAEPDALYRADDTREGFEFQRTASRLAEMRSAAYLARPHASPLARPALVET
jgi:cell division protein ZapE